MMAGYYLMYRGWLESPVFKNEPFTDREAWIWIIEEAAFRPFRKRVGNHIIELKRGQLCASVRYMAERFGWSKGRVERFLGVLKTETMISTQTGTATNIITVCNYEKYQDAQGAYEDTNGDSNPDKLGTVTGTKEKEVKEVKEITIGAEAPDEKPVKVKRDVKHGTRIEQHLGESASCPDDWANWAVGKYGWGQDRIDATFTEFYRYWKSESGQRARKLDWYATFQNRCQAVASRATGQAGRGVYDKTASAMRAVASSRYGTPRGGSEVSGRDGADDAEFNPRTANDLPF